MPIKYEELSLPGDRFAALQGGASVRQALSHLLERDGRDSALEWLVVWRGLDDWAWIDTAKLIDLVCKDPARLEDRLEIVEDLQPAMAVDRLYMGSRQAKDLVLSTPGQKMVVTEDGRLLGLLVRGPERGPKDWVTLPDGVTLEVPKSLFWAPMSKGFDIQSAEKERRYTDVSCPSRVGERIERFSAVVRLKIEPPTETQSTDSRPLEVAAGWVRVHIEAPDFEVLDSRIQETFIEPGKDSPPLVFDLKPRQAGHYQISFDFFQEGHPLGCVSASIEVVQASASVESIRTRHRVFAAIQAPSPDRVLLVRWRPRQQILALSLVQGNVPHDYEIHVGERLVDWSETLFGRLSALTDPSDPVEKSTSEIDRILKRAGYNLWRNLPEELRLEYQDHRDSWTDGSLLIISDECLIPWELVWPYGKDWEDDPWCLTMRLSRWLRRSSCGTGIIQPPGLLNFSSLACLAPQDSGLVNSKEEKEFLKRLASRFGVRNLTPDPPGWSETLDVMEQGDCDWWHFCGHGSFQLPAASSSAVWLEGERPLVPEDLVGPEIEAYVRHRRPGFFLNACRTGRLGEGWSSLEGWADHLVNLGAGFFLGPLWDVSSSAAFLFAHTFYRHLLEQKEVSEALRLSRRAVRCAGDPSWCAYSLYAQPHARLEGFEPFTIERV